MKTTCFRVIIVGILLCVMFVSFASTAFAAPSLQWQSDQVYYDSQGRLVIEGYYYNNGTRTITWVNWQVLKIYFRGNFTSWWLQAEATFENLDIQLLPGDSVRWKFRILNVDMVNFDYWNVIGNVNYNYQ